MHTSGNFNNTVNQTLKILCCDRKPLKCRVTVTVPSYHTQMDSFLEVSLEHKGTMFMRALKPQKTTRRRILSL